MKLTNYRRSLLMAYHVSGLSIKDFLNSYHRIGCKTTTLEFRSWLKLEREEISEQKAFESTVVEISASNITLQKVNKKDFSYKKLKTTCSAKIISLPNTKRNIWLINMVMEILKWKII